MKTRISLASLGAVVLAVTLVTPTAASADERDVFQPPASFQATASGTEAEVAVDATEEYTAVISGVEYAERADASVMLAAPGCSSTDKATKTVNMWQRRNPNGVAKLECGTKTGYGWRHIADGHGQDWQNILTKYKIAGTWSDFAKWNIGNTVGAPASAPYNSTNNSYTYQAPLQIKNSKGQVVRTYTVKVPVGKTTERIITAFPS
ncbi:hypothetical protein E4U02_11970 [Microbacterium paludicola]|uniref:Secreted protein n=1 Tax=Microbacterium paludicola TaxID=300019 RepID=A0A4Y9FUD6_9MICO|nr:hypothetical protein [Microbacterium paludicola]MBF0817133.1 hypothetical protein [Microbacterium paludicola]TFU32127.1 hypothetical protein E4U02_11970 [Microbacterium paludicola]